MKLPKQQARTHARLIGCARGAIYRARMGRRDPEGVQSWAWLRVARVFLRCAASVRRGDI